ncbi:MAG: MmcQ/YjbR family DNA-binding protein [Frankiales bacterium]|nr:MmcQ/YjbR family DNA-binding protein [Frankiales bacterium]
MAARKTATQGMTVDEQCSGLPGSVRGYPFGEQTAVFKVGGKIFSLVATDGTSVSLKLPPDLNLELRAAYPDAVTPGYHLNKKHWSTITLNGTPPADEVAELVGISHELVLGSLPQRVQREIG